MKTIDVKDQPRMGFKRTVNLTLHGIRYRLFRSMVTIGVITVAIAFLMNILSESLIKASVADQTAGRVDELRSASVWASRLTTTPGLEQTLREAAAAEPDTPRWEEISRMGEFTASEMAAFQQQAAKAETYLTFFSELGFGERRLLAGHSTGTAIFDAAQTPAYLDRMEQRLDEMLHIHFPGELAEFREWLKDWPALRQKAVEMQQVYATAVHELRQALGATPVLAALADAGRVEWIREAGFAFDPETAATVQEHARRELDTRYVEESLLVPAIRGAVAARQDVLPAEVTGPGLWRMLARPGDAEWFAGRLRGQELLRPELTPERIVHLAELRLEQQQLERAQLAGIDIGEGFLRLGERTQWLLFVSMLVCVVGIANAMLMAVAERFREIATLKCLGALDGFIMLMFVLEASFLGFAGGIVGALLGAVIGATRMLAAFGGLMLISFPLLELLTGILLSIILGVILAGAASIYPSFKAARLAPMEAMRIE